jgi:hypothetical protein
MAWNSTRRNRRGFHDEHYVSAISASAAGTGLYRHCEERSDEAIHLSFRGKMDCFAALAMTTGGARRPAPHRISYTTILSAMPRSAACFWIGLIASRSRIVTTAGESITGPVM